MRKLTPEQIADQQRGARRLAPGAWVDRNGGLHFSVPELLEYFGWPDTPETRAECQAMMSKILRELCPGSNVIEQE